MFFFCVIKIQLPPGELYHKSTKPILRSITFNFTSETLNERY